MFVTQMYLHRVFLSDSGLKILCCFVQEHFRVFLFETDLRSLLSHDLGKIKKGQAPDRVPPLPAIATAVTGGNTLRVSCDCQGGVFPSCERPCTDAQTSHGNPRFLVREKGRIFLGY